MKKGKLIVFEGISGTGKETQAKLLKQFLASRHIRSVIVFHPSPELKNILRRWRKHRDITSQTETLLLAGDRLSRVEQIIKPALESGQWVISLRNWVSAAVYQGDAGLVKRVDPRADVLFFFDVTPQEALRRIEKRGEVRGKFETLKLLAEKRRKYKDVLKGVPHVTVDASQSIDRIHKEVVKYIQ